MANKREILVLRSQRPDDRLRLTRRAESRRSTEDSRDSDRDKPYFKTAPSPTVIKHWKQRNGIYLKPFSNPFFLPLSGFSPVPNHVLFINPARD